MVYIPIHSWNSLVVGFGWCVLYLVESVAESVVKINALFNKKYS